MKIKITERDKAEAKKAVNRFNTPKKTEEIFYDLCFVLLAPQTTFKSNIKSTNMLKKLDFYRTDLDEPVLHEVVRATRFFRQKSARLMRAKRQFLEILNVLREEEPSVEKRNRLVKMVNGLGMKAGSHFLRNMGYKDLAIIDTHVLKYMKREAPKNKKQYLELEKEFIELANNLGLTAAELDAIVWKKYSDTPWEKFVY
jgi:N-glycosylase/DNA lyase